LAGSLKEIQSYRVSIFNSLHEITFHGNGGYTWGDVYNMPIWLRKFTFNKIKNWYDKKEEAQNASKNQIDLNNPVKANIPKSAFTPPTNSSFKSKPSYVTKASKK
jgi:hypothetical protein